MTNRLELRIYELEDKINSYEKRIQKLEARPNLYQRTDTLGQPNGMVYVHGQNKVHNDDG
jgi:hypothetical protein|tara:strand:+ start:911 stop:1090 length:180 start_codon:yes stop_codon:yes gene_type:complete